MASTAPHLSLSLLLPSLPSPRHHHHLVIGFSSPTQSRLSLRTRAMGNDFMGDFGARDPFPEELESGFAEKVLGNVDTEHKILIPKASSLSLALQDCSPASPLQAPMSLDDAKALLKNVIFQIPFALCSNKFDTKAYHNYVSELRLMGLDYYFLVSRKWSFTAYFGVSLYLAIGCNSTLKISNFLLEIS